MTAKEVCVEMERGRGIKKANSNIRCIHIPMGDGRKFYNLKGLFLYKIV
jgi:glycerate kinase